MLVGVILNLYIDIFIFVRPSVSLKFKPLMMTYLLVFFFHYDPHLFRY